VTGLLRWWTGTSAACSSTFGPRGT